MGLRITEAGKLSRQAFTLQKGGRRSGIMGRDAQGVGSPYGFGNPCDLAVSCRRTVTVGMSKGKASCPPLDHQRQLDCAGLICKIARQAPQRITSC
jgi:hypothetical protein